MKMVHMLHLFFVLPSAHSSNGYGRDKTMAEKQDDICRPFQERREDCMNQGCTFDPQDQGCKVRTCHRVKLCNGFSKAACCTDVISYPSKGHCVSLDACYLGAIDFPRYKDERLEVDGEDVKVEVIGKLIHIYNVEMKRSYQRTPRFANILTEAFVAIDEIIDVSVRKVDRDNGTRTPTFSIHISLRNGLDLELRNLGLSYHDVLWTIINLVSRRE